MTLVYQTATKRTAAAVAALYLKWPRAHALAVGALGLSVSFIAFS